MLPDEIFRCIDNGHGTLFLSSCWYAAGCQQQRATSLYDVVALLERSPSNVTIVAASKVSVAAIRAPWAPF